MNRQLSIRRHGRLVALMIAVGVVSAMASTALATPPSGLTPTVLASVNMTDPAQVKLKQADGGFAEPRQVDDILTARFELAPGGTFGWHRHSGPVVVAVTAGTLTLIMADGCVEHQVAAGQGFIESGRDVHTAVNDGTTTVVLYATFLLPDGAPPRIDQPAADC